MSATTNGTAPTYAAVPDLSDMVHFEIVQSQIEATMVDLAKHERLLRALPAKDARRTQLRAAVESTREILANYRAQEAELIGRLNSITSSATP